MDRDKINYLILTAIKDTKGIVEAFIFAEKHRPEILQIEKACEKKGLMGLGKVINSGVKEVLKCPFVYVALTTMDFDWGCHSLLVLKKGEEIVGREVRNKEFLTRLSKQKNVWFMHENFVIYKDRVNFPRDLMEKACYFEIPPLPAEWCSFEDTERKCWSVIYANPAAPCDTFLKEQYFRGLDEKDQGTILIGARSRAL